MTTRVIMVLLMMLTESGCLNNRDFENPAPGVSLDLAEERARDIHDLRYNLTMELPANVLEPVTGRVRIQFTTPAGTNPVILDFEPGKDAISAVSTNGNPSNFRTANGHIVIPREELAAGDTTIDITFRASGASINRNPDFLYTLFVPARARLAFPCFDQPDLKARLTLELTMPANWQAVGNEREVLRENQGNRVRVRFKETEPISTYLFAYAAGQFQVRSAQRNGREYRMFHRETDAGKVERNIDAAMDLHASSMAWLENYTGIPYPFGKFDFVLIPSFQFSGMEHPGAIFYNASSILLDESATENQVLNRASLIAHETAHMWFGDLVTMRWFNDVWMKEVFANFMAAKIVNPAFPNVNHDLRFLVAHYPAAYSIDRTAGTHPIRQELSNLDEAGSLYGPVIYQKAPIVMRQLERILGEPGFQEGIRAYLDSFKFGNATWHDLVRILDTLTPVDLVAWSRAWVEEAGRPEIRTEFRPATAGPSVTFVQRDTQPGRALLWTQQMDVLLGTTSKTDTLELKFDDEQVTLDLSDTPAFVLPTGNGLAYGGFILDDASRTFLLRHLPDLKDPVARGAAWVTLWEEVLDRRVTPRQFLESALRALPREDVEQNVQLIVGYMEDAFWRFIPDQVREELALQLESALTSQIRSARSSTMKATCLSAFRSMATTQAGVQFLERVWRKQEIITGLALGEEDEIAIALELAVRSAAAAPLLNEELERIANPDRKARFEFLMPALANEVATRDAWFNALQDVRNRRREPWVVEGLRYLNHPLRAGESRKYVQRGLEMLEEIQNTGDIFFPRNWTDALLNGYKTPDVAATVRDFLSKKGDYPARLNRIILQAADDLFRASVM